MNKLQLRNKTKDKDPRRMALILSSPVDYKATQIPSPMLIIKKTDRVNNILKKMV